MRASCELTVKSQSIVTSRQLFPQARAGLSSVRTGPRERKGKGKNDGQREDREERKRSRGGVEVKRRDTL